METSGFRNAQAQPLSRGIVTIYCAHASLNYSPGEGAGDG